MNVSIFIFLSRHRFSAIAVPIHVGQEGLIKILIDRIVRAFDDTLQVEQLDQPPSAG